MNISIWLSIATYITASVTCFIAYLNYRSKKPNIKFEQINSRSSSVFKPDRVDTENPDVYWQDDYRAIFDVIISNRSEAPISIIEFTLNNKLILNSYTQTGGKYTVTTDDGKEEINGLTAFSGVTKQMHFNVDNSILNPIVNIPAHSAVRGFLLFRTNDKKDIQSEKNILRIRTSRKIFKFYLKSYEYYESCLPLPDTVVKARNHKFL